MELGNDTSLISLFSYFSYLTIKVPIDHLRGQPLVKGWSVRTQVGMQLIQKMMQRDYISNRVLLKKVAGLVNFSFPEPITDYKGNFVAKVIGEGTPDILVLYAHGGGYSLCDSLTYVLSLCEMIKICRNKGKNLVIYSLEYTLAPEAKYPTQRNEFITALEYLSTEFPEVPKYLLGDSAGGNLVLTVPPALKQQNPELLKKISGVVAVSPWMSLYKPPLDHELHAAHDSVQVEDLKNHVERFLPEGVDATDPLVSPSEISDFSVFPKTFVHYGGHEVFTQDIEAFKKKANDKMANLSFYKEPLAPHITPMLIPFFPNFAVPGLNEICQFLLT